MRFTSLRMKNWRSFLGEHVIEFSVDPDRPLTLLFGPNGSGKTALLNAFTWGLYGEFTDGFDYKQRLVSNRALAADEAAEAVVELAFEHDDVEYVVRRTTTAMWSSSRRMGVKMRRSTRFTN